MEKELPSKVQPMDRSVETFRKHMQDSLYYIRGQAAYTASDIDRYMALALTIRHHLVWQWRQTVDKYYLNRPKFVYYLSAEYLPGRQITQNLEYTGLKEVAREALAGLGLDLDKLIEMEPEPGLGNGGLGRLASCFMDSLATLDIPAVGYGIRYEFGIFRQSFRDGRQVESPDEWLFHGNPWEFPQTDDVVEVGFGGRTEQFHDEKGRFRVRWLPDQTVLGEPCHTLVPGYGTGTVNLLRLWRARASQEFDFQLFDVGDYARAVEQKTASENISKVLYPNDNMPQGRELRLKQQYFFVACSIRNIVSRFIKFSRKGWEEFADKVVIQLNDTHPVVAIPELMRIFLDEVHLGWDDAWNLTRRAFAYTCHTLLPESLEKWPVGLFGRILPRHLEIVYEINSRFLDEVRKAFPGDQERLRRMSIIEEGPERRVRMANLAAVGSFSVNGVAELHSNLLKQKTLSEFYDLWPEKFNNKTNGVTPRRFLLMANPRLSDLITETIGSGWATDLDRLKELEPWADNREFRARWREIKRKNKADLADLVQERTGVRIMPDALYDIMVKRLHEYKRQLLKALHVVHLYLKIKEEPKADFLPRAVLFGAKAAPGYQMAKAIIHLINCIAETVNADPATVGKLRVAFLPNFNVIQGEIVYPGADLSEQISLAGKEASGTGNMKFSMNGAITIGTLDGANIEIREQVGADNFFLFGLTAPEVMALKSIGYNPAEPLGRCPELRQALDAIASGVFSKGDPMAFRPIVESLVQKDEYLLLVDFPAYLACQRDVEAAFCDEDRWTRMSILNTARSGFFSSDRTIRQYVEDIWKAAPMPVPLERLP